MKTIDVATASKTYQIHIGTGVLDAVSLNEYVTSKVVVIADSTPYFLYKDTLHSALEKYNPTYLPLSFSEHTKTLEHAGKITELLLEAGADRDTLVIIFGGGVPGDTASLVAATYMRGIPFIQIPTTLLSQADSSIGGKTGVNLKNAKNIFGTFTQPEAVLIDPTFLTTLPSQQIKEGLSEVTKYAIAHNESFFTYLEEMDVTLTIENLLHIVQTSASIKADIVSGDERESGNRETLNLGHTIGHALEIYTNHAMSHGQAVAAGIIFESHIALQKELITQTEFDRIVALVTKLDLCTCPDFDVATLIDIMRTDKKNKGGQIMFVLPSGIGSTLAKGAQHSFPVDPEVIATSLAYTF